ncbi:uncharacterized protein PAC_17858 [Phialocephala subalpina]|uniref:C2H2-type domain-containing protein n=1 Tax=Phialocephala subalpina TaxID=576137 RepID=A0A1L7XSJ1_9HELO|nr:uncharacterized protein PAC_17858 [Phialocephala subalpina]
MPRFELDPRSITAMNGSVQGYEPTYRTLDAREYASLRSQRLSSFQAERPPVYMRDESVTSSRRSMAQQMSDWDTMFAREGNHTSKGESTYHRQTNSPNSQKSIKVHAPLAASWYSSVDRQDSLEHQSNSDIDKGKANVTLSPTYTPSTRPNGDSSRSNNILTDHDESTDSQTDADRDVVDSEDESTAVDTYQLVVTWNTKWSIPSDNTEDEAKRMIMQTLGCCVLAAYSHDLAFAARLIPQIHSLVHSWTYNDNRNYTAAVGTSSGEVPQTLMEGVHPQQPLLRVMELVPLKSGLESEMGEKLLVARRGSGDVPHNDLRHIKDHFKNHRLSQCDRCYVLFQDSEALVEHRQLPKPCEKGDFALKEGIDDGQWEKIVHVLKKTTQKGRSDVEKWYDIWEILLPNTPPPRTPWNEPDTLSMSPSPDFETFMNLIVSRVEARIEQGIFPRNDHLYREIYSIIRHTHQTRIGDSTSPVPMIANSEPVSWHGSNAESERSPNLETSAIDRIDETADPTAPVDTPQTSVTQLTYANNIDPSGGAIGLGWSTSEAFDLQSNAPIPDFFSSEDWTESLAAPYLLSDPHPQSSNFGHATTNAPSSFDAPIIGTEHENSESNDLTEGEFDFSAFLAERLPQLDSFDD